MDKTHPRTSESPTTKSDATAELAPSHAEPTIEQLGAYLEDLNFVPNFRHDAKGLRRSVTIATAQHRGGQLLLRSPNETDPLKEALQSVRGNAMFAYAPNKHWGRASKLVDQTSEFILGQIDSGLRREDATHGRQRSRNVEIDAKDYGDLINGIELLKGYVQSKRFAAAVNRLSKSDDGVTGATAARGGENVLEQALRTLREREELMPREFSLDEVKTITNDEQGRSSEPPAEQTVAAETEPIEGRDSKSNQSSATTAPMPITITDATTSINRMLQNEPGWSLKQAQQWMDKNAIKNYDRRGWSAAHPDVEPPKSRGNLRVVDQSELMSALNADLVQRNSSFGRHDDPAEIEDRKKQIKAEGRHAPKE